MRKIYSNIDEVNKQYKNNPNELTKKNFIKMGIITKPKT